MNMLAETWKRSGPYGGDRHCDAIDTLNTDEMLICKAEETFRTAWDTINSCGWKLEKRKDNGDVVESKILHEGNRKSFRVTAVVDVPAKVLFDWHSIGVEDIPKWSPTMIESRLLKRIGQDVTITYQVTDQGRGYISPRDIVVLAKKGQIENNYVYAGVSHDYSGMPEQKGLVRSTKGPSCWVMRPIAGQDHQCTFQWFLDIDMKIWMPQAIIDKFSCNSFLDYVGSIRRHAANLRSQGKL